MERIVIGICTLNRPDGLARLLDAIARQRLTALDAREVRVEVIDNSGDGSAAAVIAARQKQYRFALGYRHECRRGLAHARNAALDAARDSNAELLVFIDDDEAPSPDWLEALIAGLSDPRFGAALGPVWPLFEAGPPPWLPTNAYATRANIEDGRVIAGYTGNAAIRMAVVANAGLRFDPRLNATGGEDTAFFRALKAAGYEIAYAPLAEVWEAVPRARMTAGWLMRRWYRTGLVEARLAAQAAHRRPAHGASTLAVNLGKGAARIAGGAVRLAAAVASSGRPPGAVLASAYTLCRGAGYVAGALGRTHREYPGPPGGS